MHPRPSGIVTLLTDFGGRDPYVGILKGAVLRRAPKAVLVDLCHEVAAQDVAHGAFLWHAVPGRFPMGTVHLAVVDPGVGTDRALLAACAHEAYWIAPDNGLCAAIVAADPQAEVRRIAWDQLGLQPESNTFHGRDLLAPIAGFLASGRYSFSALGPRVEPTPLDAGSAAPRIVHVDGFGNLISNVPVAALDGIGGVRVAGRVLPLYRTYAEAAPGELIALVGSSGLLELAQNRGHAANVLGVGRGEPIELVPA